MSTILILSGEQVSADLLRVLTQDGHRIWVAASGAEALNRCRFAPPNLLIVDVPPAGAGKKAALRLIDEAFPIPIIALGSAEVEIESLDMGAAHFVARPFDIEEVRARIRALVRRAKSRPMHHTPQGERTFWPLSETVPLLGER